MTRLRNGLLLGPLLAGSTALAEPIQPVPYDALRRHLTERVDFERLPHRAEPGFNLDMPLYAKGAWLGERFTGQNVQTGPDGHDQIDDVPDVAHLGIEGGAARQNLSVAFHRGFGSNATFPLGAAGFPELSARGEGSLAILFDHDQAELGFRIHTGYHDPLGAYPASTGELTVVFFTRDGRLIARRTHRPGPGITEYGFRRDAALRDIAGILILNTDPGGIAVDDIIFALPPLLG